MDRAGSWALAALAPAVVLAVDPWGWYPFGPIKWLLVLVLGLGGAGLVARERGLRPLPAPLGAVVVAFLAWLGVAAAFGDDRLYAWVGTPERHLGVVTWLLCALLLVVGGSLDRGGTRRVVDGLLVAGLGVGGFATAEALGWEPKVFAVAPRLSGTLGSPAYLGAATALLLPVAVALLVAGTGRRRWVSGVASVVLLVACLGSGARAAWVGLAVAAAVGLAAMGAPVWTAARARPARTAGAVAGLVVIGVAVLLLTPVGGRLSDATDPDAAGGRGRLDEWRVASRVVADHPLVGVGPEGYLTAFHTEVDAGYERVHGRRQQPDRAHSAPLDLALDGGLPLVAAWLAILAYVGRSAWRALRRGPWWLRGVAAGLVAHWAGQLLLFPVVELEPVAWLLAGVVVADPATRAPVHVPVPDREPVEKAVGRPTVFSTGSRVGGVVLGGLAIVGLLAGVTDVVADHRAERAVDALTRGDGPAALAAADSAAGLRPDEVRLHLLAAQAAVADQRGFQAGLDRVADALAVARHDPIARLQRTTLLVDRAEATQTVAHLSAARRDLDAALRSDPNAAALWRLDARLAQVEGHVGLVRQATARADALTPPDQRR